MADEDDPGAAARGSGTGALGALLLADARLPTGGHAHSATLEGAVAAGLAAEQVPAYIRARLRTVARTEAAAAVLALRAGRGRPVDYGPVQAALAARTPSAPLRAASASLGRGLTRLARALCPGHPAVAGLATATAATPGLRPLRPVVLGALGAALGLTEAQTARAVLYDDAQTVTAAALKLHPGDPLATVRWVVDAADDIEAAVRAAVAVAAPADLPARSAPLIDQWAAEHAQSTRRLFIA
ncbi:urease accessory protein UreF [Marinitenerispora sediminis]|uniref:urease accessory protein UreF n=2 Tax=Marinitenerispora sediminis TaxID=1931232 RepID=UPI000DF4AD87|nr:urease accessory UreF family protein [Marinitenerispora sediminis]RCV52191.1 urease accessory protein [Marinitenerispora sediminis]RCV53092.1 urease accessory protein [Marinitenerispora sediminis]